ncbi:MAG: signal peptidase II [Chloroflexi bacterium]|nr:signal peptidase II [Chloroflexota bacterium]
MTPNKRAWLYDLYLAALILLAFILDQATKGWVRGNLALGESLPPTGFFRITHTYNTGSAFGLFPNQTLLLMMASIAGIAILLLYFRNLSIPPFWLRTSLGLQLGGAAGNLVDRITLGRVTDFLDAGSWPVFNLADSSIMIGIGILAWCIWRSPKATAKPKEEAKEQEAPLVVTVVEASRGPADVPPEAPQQPHADRHG